jgi:catechol 2,3-dioxygenase-like lactoylglutathione lyase family enzyme
VWWQLGVGEDLIEAVEPIVPEMWHHRGVGTTIHVTGLDHLVLVCADVEQTLAWYCGLLGLEPVRVDEWRRGEVPFPSVRVSDSTIVDLFAGQPSDGRLDHFCLVIEHTDLAAIAASGEFEVVDGPGRRFGARGDGTSLYVRDPDGTVVELRHY